MRKGLPLIQMDGLHTKLIQGHLTGLLVWLSGISVFMEIRVVCDLSVTL